MNIQHDTLNKEGRFFISENNDTLAELTYTKSDNHTMVINHTEVSPSLEGKGIGKQLVQHAVSYARTSHLKIVPICAFAKKLFDKTPEFQDVLA